MPSDQRSVYGFTKFLGKRFCWAVAFVSGVGRMVGNNPLKFGVPRVSPVVVDEVMVPPMAFGVDPAIFESRLLNCESYVVWNPPRITVLCSPKRLLLGLHAK